MAALVKKRRRDRVKGGGRVRPAKSGDSKQGGKGIGTKRKG